MMPRPILCFLLMLGAVAPLAAAPGLTSWERVDIAPMKTSVYVGRVTLVTATFERQGSTLAATYQAKVFPWFFLGETGKITITLTDTVIARLAKGEAADFTGSAANHRNKPRQVTGRAEPASATTGRITVRILGSGVDLNFESTYKFAEMTK